MSKSVSFSESVLDSAGASDIRVELEDDEAPQDRQGKQFNKFALLGLEDGVDQANSSASDGDCDPADDSQADEDNGKPTNARRTVQHNDGSNKRKPRKKRGKKGSKNKNKDLEEVENEVEQLNKAVVLSQSGNEKCDRIARFKLLKVNTRNLIPEVEIKRMFGKGVIKEDKSSRLRLHSGSNLQRSRFVSHYFEAKASGDSSGLRMELDDTMNEAHRIDLRHTTGYDPKLFDTDTAESSSVLFNSDEPIYFKFVHDQAYQQTQREFLIAVNQGNPEGFVQNLSHAESLIQISHLYRVSEDYKMASEMIERALMVFERSFHPKFNLATANSRLTYKRPENRTFFITIFKHISYCHRRGLRRTPFEYSKLLLSLEPENDPLQAIQLIDFYALRSEEYDYVIDFYKKWDRSQKLPNMSYSVALAHFMKSKNAKQTKEENIKHLHWADEFLQRALKIFPNFIIPLLDACSGEPSDELKKCTYFDYSVYGTNYQLVPETVEVLISLYVRRSYILWKQKPVVAWLERNVECLVNKFKSGELTDERHQIEHWQAFPKVVPKNLLRHIVLCDLDMKLPTSASSSTFLDIDPYPPTDSIVSYDPKSSSASNQAGQGESSGSIIGDLGSLFVRSIFPSFSLNNQQQAGPTSAPAQSSHNRAQVRRQPGGNQTRQGPDSSTRGLQITLADYVLDEEGEEGQGGQPGGHYNEMHSTIRDLTNTVANLLNMQSALLTRPNAASESGNQPDQNGSDSQQDGGSGSGNASARREGHNP